MPELRHAGTGAIHLTPDTPPRSAALVLLVETPPWMADALCAQTDPEAFFPEMGGSTREAKAICRSCTVAAECLDWALDNDERFGIWGGLSERERRRIKRAVRPAVDRDVPCRHDGCGRIFPSRASEKTHAARHCEHIPTIDEQHDPAIHNQQEPA